MVHQCLEMLLISVLWLHLDNMARNFAQLLIGFSLPKRQATKIKAIMETTMRVLMHTIGIKRMQEMTP